MAFRLITDILLQENTVINVRPRFKKIRGLHLFKLKEDL